MSAWLVDTHALLWYLAGDPRLSADAKRTLESGESIVFVSAASVWEMAVKASIGKLALPEDLAEGLDEEGFESLDVTFDHAWRVGSLPVGDHKDPFDRLLVAQALVEELPIVSNDSELDRYGIERHW